MRYALDLFIPPVSRNLQYGKVKCQKTEAQNDEVAKHFWKSREQYHRKLTPGVVASDISTM